VTSTPSAKRSSNQRSSIFFSETDGLWHGWVSMGVRNDGKPDRRHRQGRTRADVTAKVRQLEAQRDAGRPLRPGRAPTVGEWLSVYFDTVCERLVSSGTMAPRTLEDYRSKARLWIIPSIGRHRLDRLLPEHLDAAYSQMYAQGLSSSTVLKVHRILSRALTVAVRRDKVARNVAQLIDAPAPADSEITPFTQTEARAIIDTARHRRNGARWLVALALGLRQGEALGLRWSYLDLDTGVIKAWSQVQRSRWQHGCSDAKACGARWHRAPCKESCRIHRHSPECEATCKRRDHRCPRATCDPRTCTGHARHCPSRRGGGVEFRPRKGKRRLTLQCPPELLPLLRAHRTDQARERLAAGERWQDHDLVFTTFKGLPIDRTDDWREWHAVLRLAGVRPGRLHDARHTAGTLLIEQGVHLRVVQEILGHTRITTTERYTHVASPQVRDATERIGRALLGD
jgi:integrase